MEYTLSTDGENLAILTECFNTALNNNGVKVGQIKRTLIILNFIDLAKKRGILKEIGAGTPPEEPDPQRTVVIEARKPGAKIWNPQTERYE